MQKEVKQFKNKLKIKAAENSKDRLIHTSFLTKVTCWNHRKGSPDTDGVIQNLYYKRLYDQSNFIRIIPSQKSLVRF